MQVTIMESPHVADAGAVLAVRDGKKIIVLDPDLSEAEKRELVRELLEQ